MDWHDKRVQIPKSGKICFTEKKFTAVELTFSFFFSWQENHGGGLTFAPAAAATFALKRVNLFLVMKLR